MGEIKFALVTADSARVVWRYLPDNYVIFTSIPLGDAGYRTEYLIAGIDKAGWTLEDYVLPRFWSGLIACEALNEEQALAFAKKARQ